MSEQYQCSVCQGLFDYLPDEEWSDDDARAEYQQNFGTGHALMAIVCDDCYQEMMADLTGGRRP